MRVAVHAQRLPKARWLALILAAGLGAGCAGGQPGAARDGDGAATVERLPTSPTQECEVGKESWRAKGPPQRGSSIVVATFAQDATNLDGLAPGRGNPLAQVNQGLFEPRGCYYEDTAVAPRLVSNWSVSPDGLTWTMKLQEGAAWHNRPPVNGRRFTSADVAWTVEQQQKGGRLRSYWTDVAHSEPDAATVVFKLPKPDADFLAKLGHHENRMYAREIAEQYGDFRTVAIGTGPFMLATYKPGQDATLKKNPAYHLNGADGKPLPYVDEVRSLALADAVAELVALRTGQLDHSTALGIRPAESANLRQSAPKLRYHQQIQFTHWALWFALDRAPWDNPNVRKALAAAVNREEIREANQGLPVHSSFVPAFLKEYTWAPDKAKDKFKMDREAAKRLLEGTGFDTNKEYELRTAALYQAEAEVVQQQLRAVGIKTRIEVEAQSFSQVITTRKVTDLAWGAISTPPFVGYYMGDFIQTGGSQNYTGLKDARLHDLALAQSRELDPQKRKLLIDQIQDRLYEIMPWVPALSNVYHHFQSCRLRNASQVNPAYNQPMLAEAWLDPTGC